MTTSTRAPDQDPASTTAAFGARTPWTAAAAIFFVLVTVLTAGGVAVMAGTVYFQIGQWLQRSSSTIASDHVTIANTMLAMIVMQSVIIAMVWWGAGRFGGKRLAVLSLAPLPSPGVLLIGLGGMVALLAPYNLAVYLLWPGEFGQDLRPFADLARSPVAWLGALVVAIGAPLSEELLFRGFLLPAVTKTGYGFRGAAVLTTLGWTLLHLGYSVAGLLEVLIIGLYFSWLMWRYSSLWLPLVLHGLYNGLQLALLAVLPV